MAKKIIKKIAKIDRKDYLRKALLEHLKEIQPELNRKIDMYKVITPDGMRGSFKNYLKGNFKPGDRLVYQEILLELKKKRILVPIYSRWWARLK